MADVITYLDSQPKKIDHNESNNCKCNVYPGMVTHSTWQMLCDGCQSSINERNCNDCCWMCLPFSVAADFITLIPFLVIYTGKRLCKK